MILLAIAGPAVWCAVAWYTMNDGMPSELPFARPAPTLITPMAPYRGSHPDTVRS
jgi:hypothetical protein